jgi:hypothetical protein
VRGKIASTALAMPTERGSEALAAILDLHRHGGPIPVALGLRFVKGSSATLGFTRWPRTCILEVDGIDCRRTDRFLATVRREIESRDIPHAYHWGKMHVLTRDSVRLSYGDGAVDAWIAARERILPTPALRARFSNEVLVAAGLAT